MLETKDLEAIALLLDSKLKENNEQMKEFVREFVTEFVDERITKSEAFLLEEMERMNNATNVKIESMQKNIDELTQYYRITKLENDNTTLLLRMVSRLQEDVEELKKKTA